MSKSRKILLITLCAVLLAVLLFSGYKLYSIVHEYKVAERMYDSLGSQFVSARDETKVTSAPTVDGETIDPDISPIDVDFAALKERCKDVKAWIYSPGTVINYPIVQGEDNEYYVHRFLDGSYNASGTLFVDMLCAGDFSGPNTVVYGHHMNDNSMFASLCNYKQQEYYDEHPSIYISTPDANYRVDLFTGFVTDPGSDAFTIFFINDDEKMAYVDTMRSRSTFKSDVEVDAKDQLVTLNTCIYDYENARYVAIGKLVKIQ